MLLLFLAVDVLYVCLEWRKIAILGKGWLLWKTEVSLKQLRSLYKPSASAYGGSAPGIGEGNWKTAGSKVGERQWKKI